MVGVEIANPSEFFWIGFSGVKAFEDNDLVGLDSGGFVHGSGIEASESEIALGSGNKEGGCLVNSIKAIEIQIPAVDDIKGSRFEDQLIEDVDIVDLAMSDDHERGDTSPKIQKGMQFHGAFAGSEFGPRKNRQAQIDGGGVQRVGGLIQVDPKGIVGVKTTSLGNQDLSEVGIDPPIPNLIGMGQSIARNLAPKTHMIEFSLA